MNTKRLSDPNRRLAVDALEATAALGQRTRELQQGVTDLRQRAHEVCPDCVSAPSTVSAAPQPREADVQADDARRVEEVRADLHQNRPQESHSEMLLSESIPISQSESPRRESGIEGASKAAMHTGSLTITGAYGTGLGILAYNGLMTGAQLATGIGVPVATGIAGGLIGKKLGHAVLGANVGAALGVGGLAVTPYIAATASGAGAQGLVGAGLLGAMGLSSVAVPCAVGAGLYGLGRWQSNLWNIHPDGVLKNIALGIPAIVGIPATYAYKLARGVGRFFRKKRD